MIDLVNQIRFNQKKSSTKKEKIVNAVSCCIQDNSLKLDDILPSVNELSSKIGFSRETVVLAYKDLKKRGIIDAKQGLGYFVSNNELKIQHTVALVLYGFQTFQQDFYNSFRNTLGERFKIDVFFHHNNYRIYESILNDIHGSYGHYVIAPIQNHSNLTPLQKFPENKLFLIDRYKYVGERVSKITQEFEQSLISVLAELLIDIKKYERLILFYKSSSDYPKEILSATKQFCENHNIELQIQDEYKSSTLSRGNLYFTIGDSDLWNMLKDIKDQNFKLGKDIGILSHNDSPVKDIILDGITTFSTDFVEMGKQAANALVNNQFVNTIIPGKLIKRNSI